MFFKFVLLEQKAVEVLLLRQEEDIVVKNIQKDYLLKQLNI